MRSCAISLATFMLTVLLVLDGAPPVRAAPGNVSCLAAIAKEGRTFVAQRLKVLGRCHDAELHVPGGCPAPDPVLLAKIEERLADRIARKCDGASVALATLGFPGPCIDVTPEDGFTTADLVACIRTSHAAAVDAVEALLFDGTLASPLRFADLHCQEATARHGAGFTTALLGAVQKCRNGILRGRIIVPPERCAIDDPPTREAIAKAERRFRRLVDGRCSDAQATRLQLCEPDQPTVTSALDCLVAEIRALVDDPDPASPPDLIDFEYATRPPASCGDGRVDAPGEECDGGDDALCPGQCGASSSLFPCLCQNVKRQRVIEHAAADFDLWWTGTSHDRRVAEGGGYLVDLWDCDGEAGPDTTCTVGPSCSAPPHSPCSPGPSDFTTGDAMCAALGEGACRTTPGGATGPHCMIEFQRRCASNAQCTAPGDRCLKTFHGPPLPVSAGGIPTCLLRVFSEDVVGTTDLVTGSSDVRLRQRLLTYLGGDEGQPCPVCGGFCAGEGSQDEPGPRTLCTSDADCAYPPNRCVTDAVCSFGPNVDGRCRPDVPFGGPTFELGTTSIDCLPPPAANISGLGLDVLENPRTTSTVRLTADVQCAASAFSGNACIGGPYDGRPCDLAADCPAGACHPQCFCGGETQPNACGAACVGGANDAAPCASDGDCPDGFCHHGDCRLDPSDNDSCQEGRCTVGPLQGACSTSRFKVCAADVDCQAPACPRCALGEACVFALPQCFVNGEIERCGNPGLPDRTTAAVQCVPGTGTPSVDMSMGAPGPAALTQPETTVIVGF